MHNFAYFRLTRRGGNAILSPFLPECGRERKERMGTKMKKLIAMMMAVCMMLTMGLACAEESAETIVVAFNPEYPPFEYVENGEYMGYDVDLINAVAEKAGFNVEFEAMAFDAVIAAVQTNVNTIGVSGISITDERKLSVDFSEGYINAGLIVVVKKDSGYTTTDDLKGKVIGVQLGTTSDFAAEEITGLDNTAQYSTFLAAINDLQGDKVDAVIVDKPVGMAILASLQDDNLEIVDMGLQADWYGIEVNKDNPELLEKINAALAELEAEGFYDELAVKYFSEETEATTAE